MSSTSSRDRVAAARRANAASRGIGQIARQVERARARAKSNGEGTHELVDRRRRSPSRPSRERRNAKPRAACVERRAGEHDRADPLEDALARAALAEVDRGRADRRPMRARTSTQVTWFVAPVDDRGAIVAQRAARARDELRTASSDGVRLGVAAERLERRVEPVVRALEQLAATRRRARAGARPSPARGRAATRGELGEEARSPPRARAR